MGPLTLEQFRDRLGSPQPERKLAALSQLWEAFRLRCAFLESAGTNAFSATAVAETGVGTFKEVGGMLSLQLTPFRELTGVGVRERADSSQLILAVGEKELHLPWPGPLSTMLEDQTFQWIMARLQSGSESPQRAG